MTFQEHLEWLQNLPKVDKKGQALFWPIKYYYEKWGYEKYKKWWEERQ